MRLETSVRSVLSECLSSIPNFKGKGRLTLLADKLLTDYQNPQSYQVIGTLNNGVPFHFDLRPWGQKFAYYYQHWELDYVNILRRLYSGGTFLDVGSSLGLYVVCLGERVRAENGLIVSVEPVPFNLERQKKNVTLNNLDDLVDYVIYALSNRRGNVWIRTDPIKADNNAIIAETGDLEIEVIPLDELVTQRGYEDIRLVKIDVEGYEPLVIEGGRKTIRKNRPIIFAEFCRERMKINGFSMDAVWQFLIRELHYSCYFWNPKFEKLCQLEEVGDFENIFFIPPDTVLPVSMVHENPIHR